MALIYLRIAAILVGVYLDILSTILNIRKARTCGPAPSGIPFVPWILYAFGSGWGLVLLPLTVFHIVVNVLIPIVYVDWFNGRTRLHRAARLGSVRLVEWAIRGGAGLDARDNRGRTALHEAAGRKNTAVLQNLLARGAQPNAADCYGVTPMRIAVRSENRQAVELLLRYGADPDSNTDEG
ncbi:MAG TPA: ankyrin repeat domain-containing protein [Armatimonadota bacterium]